uniref:Uncharacterized protein n=1 Tax=Neovison vison TaxID=452646 RepID=A0A8C7AVJ4_NEOVI
MEGQPVAGRGRDLFLHNFSGRLWEQFAHFPVLLWADLDLLFLWEATTPHLRHLAMVPCHCCDSVWVSTSPSEDGSLGPLSSLSYRLGRKHHLSYYQYMLILTCRILWHFGAFKNEYQF